MPRKHKNLRRYHKDVYMPRMYTLHPSLKFNLSYDAPNRKTVPHVQKRIRQYNIDPSTLPTELVIAEATLIEVNVIDGIADSWLFRMPYDEEFDLILSITMPNNVLTPTAYVKTLWLNRISDHHDTLSVEYETE